MNVNQILYCVAGALVLVIAWALAVPKYRVYSQDHTGKALLARAENERQVLVQQAQAERDSAELRAQAIAIVGEAAQKYPEYRKQEFIGAFAEALQNGVISQVIYVPTEASIPVLEAGKR